MHRPPEARHTTIDISLPEISTSQIYKGALPFIALPLVGLLMLRLFPELATWLPKQVYE